MNELTVSDGAVLGPVRVWLRIEGLSVFVLAFFLYMNSGVSWWLFTALFLTPDLSMLGYLINTRMGSVSYNIVHSYVLPVNLVVIALVFGRTAVLPYLFIWFAHIGLDRGLGYGMKYSAAFGRTHLGVLTASRRHSAP